MTKSRNNKERVIFNTLFLYLRMIVTIAVGLYASRMVLNVLGESDFGIFSLVGGVVVILSFLNSGMLQASQRFLSYSLGKSDFQNVCRTFWATWYAHAFLAILIVIIGEIVGLYVVNYVLSIPADRMEAANWVYQCSLFTCAVSVLSVPYNSAIIAHERMDFFAYTSILEAVFKLLIIYLLLVVSYDKLILYALLMLSVQVFVRFLYTIYCKRHFEECNSVRTYDKAITKDILSFAGWSLLGNFGITCRDQVTNIIFNVFFQTPVVNAARGIATQVSGIISTFATNITMAINPQITKNYSSGNMKESVSLVFIGCRASFYMLTLIVVPFVVNVDYVLELWLGKVPENTSLFLYFILGVALIYSLSQPITIAIQATGEIKAFQIWIFSLMLLEVCLTYIVLWLTGSLVYALVPSVVVNFITVVVRMVLVKKKVSAYSFRQYACDVVFRCIMVLLISFLVAIFIHNTIGYESLVAFLGECVILAISTIVIILLFGLKSEERLQLIGKLTMSVKHINGKRV